MGHMCVTKSWVCALREHRRQYFIIISSRINCVTCTWRCDMEGEIFYLPRLSSKASEVGTECSKYYYFLLRASNFLFWQFFYGRTGWSRVCQRVGDLVWVENKGLKNGFTLESLLTNNPNYRFKVTSIWTLQKVPSYHTKLGFPALQKS